MEWSGFHWPGRSFGHRDAGSGRGERAGRSGGATRDGSDDEGLVAESEAFLTGRYLGRLRERGNQVPGWAWLNTLAHGDVPALQRLRQAEVLAIPPRSSWSEEAWRTAQRLLARDLLEMVGDDGEALRRLQDAVLVPFELELIARRSIDALSALELVQSTRAALHAAIW